MCDDIYLSSYFLDLSVYSLVKCGKDLDLFPFSFKCQIIGLLKIILKLTHFLI